MMDKIGKKVTVVVFVAVMAMTVLVCLTTAVIICDSGSSKTCSYDGRWIGSTSYSGEVCGEVWFNVSENVVETFGVYKEKKIPFDIIDSAGIKVGSGFGSGGIEFRGINATIVNDQFNYTSTAFGSNSILGIFTSDNNANGTWKYVSKSTMLPGMPSYYYVYPLITWSARRVQTTGDININEIMYNPPGADTDHEWLELYNNDTTDIDIKGWRFYEAGINHSLTLIQGSRIISAGGYAIIADNATMFLDEHQECNCTVIDSAFSLNNSGDYIALKNAILGIIDKVAYNTSWGADGNNRTLELNATGGWEESRVDEGTPCQQNSVLAVDYSGE